jgi:hypothetical protein
MRGTLESARCRVKWQAPRLRSTFRTGEVTAQLIVYTMKR